MGRGQSRAAPHSTTRTATRVTAQRVPRPLPTGPPRIDGPPRLCTLQQQVRSYQYRLRWPRITPSRLPQRSISSIMPTEMKKLNVLMCKLTSQPFYFICSNASTGGTVCHVSVARTAFKYAVHRGNTPLGGQELGRPSRTRR